MEEVDESFGPGSQAALRDANQQRVARVLQSSGELTQAEIARSTGLAPATVSNIIRDMTSDGVVVVSELRGRRRVVSLAPSVGLVVGIDFGHRHVTVAVSDMAHEIRAEHRAELGVETSAAGGIARAASLLQTALNDLDADMSAVVGIGMGLPAPIDGHSGEVGAPSILPGWVGMDAAAMMSERFGMRVAVDNDANLGVLAEHMWGAGIGVDNMAYLKLSDGVGAGLVLNGKLFRGRDGTAGEIGHTTMDEFGAVCRCGNRGCLETIVASGAVLELLEPRRGRGLTIPDVVQMARDGDKACERILTDTGRHVGVAVANLCNIFNPELILVGGELAIAGELLMAPMREVVRRCGIPSATANLQILPAALGARAPVLGAVALALQSAHIPLNS